MKVVSGKTNRVSSEQVADDVLAQRLVRKLCPQCRQAHVPDATEAQLLEMTPQQADEITINVPGGCPFHPRCVYAELNGGACETDRPEFLEISARHFLACHLSSQDRQRVWENDILPML